MDANEAQEEYEEVQTELRKKEEEVCCLLNSLIDVEMAEWLERKLGILCFCL